MSWRGLDHRTIYEMVVHGGQGIGVADAAEAGWKAAHQAVLDADGVISGALLASRSDWQGLGADAMRTAFSPLAQWALDAATSAGGTAGGVGGQAVLAMETRRLVADNAPPQTFGEHVVDVVGDWEGGSIYDDHAAAVDRLMTGYEAASVPNEQRFDTWSVPPTVVVAAAGAGPSGPGGGAGAIPDTGGLGAAGGSGIAAALAPGHGAAGPVGGAVSGAAGSMAPGGGAGVLPGAAASIGGGIAGGIGASGAIGGVGGVGGVGAGGVGAGGVGAGGVGAGGAGAAGAGFGAAGAGRPAAGGSGPGARALGTGGVAHPSQRRPGSPGGSGTGPGPWSRSVTSAGRPSAVTAFRPVAPALPPRASTPDWRTVLLPPERDAARPPGEAATRSGGSTAAQGTGTRAAGSGMYAPMMGGGAGGAQGEGRRRASYLIDDSDAFVDHRWVQPAVITPEDLIPDEYGRLPGQ